MVTIDAFNDLNSDNLPDQSRYPDWVGKIDSIHVMGDQEMYENAANRGRAGD